MTPEALRDLVVHALDEMKGTDITALEVSSLTSLTDYMIICTGSSSRHVKALSDAVSKALKAADLPKPRIEGDKESEWILIDMGDVVAHIMLAATRDFYSLEELWEPVAELRESNA